jgi:16S rRNA (cytidine1402-2'-O)-methyltransferase
LVSNAGTPAVSDPGFQIIRAAIANGLQVIPVPGVSAAITALSAAGLPTDSFVYMGFLAKRQTKRLKQLRELAREKRTIICYESPKRIMKLLDEMIRVIGNRYGVLSRELTKRHEEFLRGSLSEIRMCLNERSAIKGELTLLVAGAENTSDVSTARLRAELRIQMVEKQAPLSESVKFIANKYGISKSKVYREALEVKTKKRSHNSREIT